MGLRERNRRNTLVTTQRLAIEMFMAHGYDEVKISEIAAEAEIAASTLYRHFPTKESIVVWDEHEAAWNTALTQRLRSLAPFEALHRAFVDCAALYDDDADFHLQRVGLIVAHPAITAASAGADAADRSDLAELVEPYIGTTNEPDDDWRLRAIANTLAASALLAGELAFEQWHARSGEVTLAELMDAQFDQLAALASLG